MFYLYFINNFNIYLRLTDIRKIVIIGNSVGLRVRPPISSNNYGNIIQQKRGFNENTFLRVDNMSFGRATISEILVNADSYINRFPDTFIINVGAVEAPNREIPLWYSDLLYKRRRSIFYPLLSILYGKLIARNRTFVSKLRNKPWVGLGEFHNKVESLIDKLQKNTKAKIVIIGINPGSERIESVLPGTLDNYICYNSALEEIAMKKNLDFISVVDLNSDDHFPDGVHYNETGHQVIATRILSVLNDL